MFFYMLCEGPNDNLGLASRCLHPLSVINVRNRSYASVYFLQDPEVLLQKHDPQVHHGLNAAWVNMQAASGPTAVETLSPQGYARVRVN